MRIERLSLTNFRNYGRLEVSFPPGPILLHGANAQGKTNILEAIAYLATTRSPRAERDHQLINWDAGDDLIPVTVGRLVATVVSGDQEREIELRLIREQRQGALSFRREALVNRRKVRLMDMLGQLRVVLFLPQDLRLVTGSPTQRRRYLDIALCQTYPSYCRALSQYNKVLEQRNALLRSLAEDSRGEDLLPVFDERLVEMGSIIFVQRTQLLNALALAARRIHYEELTAGQESIQLVYEPRLVAKGKGAANNHQEHLAEAARWLADRQNDLPAVQARFGQAIADARPLDLQRTNTTIGPHRDDWRFLVNGKDLRHYGSRGQQRSAVLALKMSEIAWIGATTGEQPLLLLDEVMAELDSDRRQALISCAHRVDQTLLTAATATVFPDEFLAEAATFRVDAGQLILESKTPAIE